MAQGPTEFHYDVLPSLPEEDDGSPQPLLGSETLEWGAIPNLDYFFSWVYKYYEEKGFAVILVSRILNLLALAFTIMFSAFLLLFVKWRALHSECILRDTCDISEVAFERHPLKDGFTLWNTLRVMYLAIFAAYWLYNLVHCFLDLREAAVIKHFTQHRLGLSPRQLRTVTWPEVARRIVDVQKHMKLHITKELTEKDVVSRIMRKENYLIGMLNKGVLALNVSVPGLGKRFMLTKTLEWNLNWCLLDTMLDHNFQIKEEFTHDVKRLQWRFRMMAIFNLLVAPFVLVFLLIYFFMRNAEKFYHQPSSAGARRWSALAAWRLREFNELPHYLNHRLLASQKAAEKYIGQFPMPILSHVAKFIAFLTGSFAALLLFVALLDDDLLERHLFGRNLVWWAATLGIVLAISRGFIAEQGVAFEPELALLEVVAHTHWLPRHWRGRGHTREVQEQFQQLFQFKALLFLEEMASIVVTPFVLYFSLPQCAPAILAFLRDFTVRVDGVGDICSMAGFDFERHGNAKYGSPSQAPKASRSRQGKMEKSLLSFAATYPTWEPDAAAKQMLMALGQAPPLRGPAGASTDLASMQSAVAASLFPGAPRNPAYHNISPYGAAAASSMQRLVTRTCPGLTSMGGSMFASTDMVNGPQSIIGLAGADPEERVTTGQLLLQSFYEDQDRAMRLGGLHHTSLSGDVKHMQASLPGRMNGRAALHLHDGHFYAPSQPADQSTQAGGWSVGSAAALLGMRARSSSGREASPSSEMAVLNHTAPVPFGGSAQQPVGDAAAHVTQPGKKVQQGFAAGYAQAVPGAATWQGSQASHAAHSSRHSSSTSSRAGPGSLPGAGASYSGHSSAPVSPMHASGRFDGSRHSSAGLGLSRLQSSSGFQSRHEMPRSLGSSARGDESGISQPGSAAGLHLQHRVSSAAHHLDEAMHPSQQHPLQHPLQNHWGLGHGSEVDQHNFAVERSYSPSSGSRSAVSAHEEDEAPFAGEDSHVLSEWGHEPDRGLHNHGSDLMPQRFPFGAPVNAPQSDGLYSRDGQGCVRDFLNASRASSAGLQPEQQHGSAQLAGSMGSGQAGTPEWVPKEDASFPGSSDGSRVHEEGMPVGPVGWGLTGGPGVGGPLVRGSLNGHLGQPGSGLADSRVAGVSTQLHDSADLDGWYEAEHSDED